MATRLERLVPLPENISAFSVMQGEWNGIGVDVTEATCSGRVLHHLCYEDETRINALLEERGGSPCEPRLHEHQPCQAGYTPRHLYMAPAGMDLWGYGADLQYARDVTLRFDVPALEKRFGVSLATLSAPRLRFSDERLWTLMKLLAEAVGSPDPSMRLYGDGLTAAIVAHLAAERCESVHSTDGALAPWQLRRVIEYLTEHANRRVELKHLASLVGLSQSRFSRAFKASTGQAPYRWQLAHRVDRAKMLLSSRHARLDEVAEATGFADAVHFGRTFRRIAGASPAAWRRQQGH